MNTNQAREILIEKVLQKEGYSPSKTIKNDSWYLSPFRVEKTPSFKLNLKLNRWFDHGEQVGGNVIDFLIHKFGFSITEALKYLEPYSNTIDFSFQKQKIETDIPVISIIEVKPIQHPALIQYLENREILNFGNIEQLKEIHYSINEKEYFGIGFKNRSNGWEIRSKYSKICLLKKDVSLIKNGSNSIRVFEGFFDYLAFIQINGKEKTKQSDNLILNSVALLEKNISILGNYKLIELYLDNDEAGNKYTEMIISQFIQAKDFRQTYFGRKDLNEFLCEKHLQKG